MARKPPHQNKTVNKIQTLNAPTLCTCTLGRPWGTTQLVSGKALKRDTSTENRRTPPARTVSIAGEYVDSSILGCPHDIRWYWMISDDIGTVNLCLSLSIILSIILSPAYCGVVRWADHLPQGDWPRQQMVASTRSPSRATAWCGWKFTGAHWTEDITWYIYIYLILNTEQQCRPYINIRNIEIYRDIIYKDI